MVKVGKNQAAVLDWIDASPGGKSLLGHADILGIARAANCSTEAADRAIATLANRLLIVRDHQGWRVA